MLSALTTVILRIIALKVALDGISSIATLLVSLPGDPQWIMLIVAALFLVLSFGIWIFAPVISRRMCPDATAISPISASLYDLYAFAFLLVGTYSIGTAVGPALSWIHYLFSTTDRAETDTNLYPVFELSIKIVIGVILLTKSQSLAQRLIRKQAQQDAAANP